MTDPWKFPVEALGAVIKAQRQLAQLSQRELASMTDVSNAYLSQIERGMHEPSVRVLRSIAMALGIPPETLLERAGLIDHEPGTAQAGSPAGSTEAAAAAAAHGAAAVAAAIRSDPALTDEQKQALLSVYESYVGREPSSS